MSFWGRWILTNADIDPDGSISISLKEIETMGNRCKARTIAMYLGIRVIEN